MYSRFSGLVSFEFDLNYLVGVVVVGSKILEKVGEDVAAKRETRKMADSLDMKIAEEYRNAFIGTQVISLSL